MAGELIHWLSAGNEIDVLKLYVSAKKKTHTMMMAPHATTGISARFFRADPLLDFFLMEGV